MKLFTTLFVLFWIISFQVEGQQAPPPDEPQKLIPPIDPPLSLSGNFGELRTNHFHSGLDFRTQGHTGIPVHSVADGYVARVDISPTGYGRAVYINHPNGITTVYGHLERLMPALQRYVRRIQYKREQFEVNLAIPRDSFPVKQGEVIAWSGNAGSSGGPHLHFEIRDTQTQRPQNGLKWHFPITDNIPPKIISLYAYSFPSTGVYDDNRYPTVFYSSAYHLKGNPVLKVSGPTAFGIQAVDYLNASWSKCGIYSAQLVVDQDTVFGFQINDISFTETRYVNSLADYAERERYGRWVHRLFRQPGNKLDIYTVDKNNGIVNFTDDKTHDIKVITADAYGNQSTLEFQVQSTPPDSTQRHYNGARIFSYKKDNYFQSDNLKLKVPEGALYDDLAFHFEEGPKPKGCYAPLQKIQDKYTPLQKAIRVAIKPDSLPESLQKKALLVMLDEPDQQKWSAGGRYEDGWVVGYPRNFGDFSVAVDTIPPSIQSLSIKDHKNLMNPKHIRFKIKDDLSGIDTYRGEIDGKWALFVYDPKYDLLTYTIDTTRVELGKTHQLKLKVTDVKGNQSIYSATFYK